MYKEREEDGERRSQREIQRNDKGRETLYGTVRARDGIVLGTHNDDDSGPHLVSR